MKKNYLLVKTLAFIIVLVLSAVSSVFADEDGSWEQSYFEDFSNIQDTTLSNSYMSEIQTAFSAAIKNSELQVRSDSLCYFKLDDINDVNSTNNSHGITLLNTKNLIKKLDKPVILDGREYYFQGGGDNSVYFETIDGKGALKHFTYVNGAPALRTNISRYIVDSPALSSTDNNLTVEIMYYSPATEGDNYIKFGYRRTNGTMKDIILLNKDEITEAGCGTWVTKTINLTDADFSQLSTVGSEQLNLRIQSCSPVKNSDGSINYEVSNIDAVNYIHSIKIYKTPQEGNQVEIVDVEKNKILRKKLLEDTLYGEARFSFDMQLPSGIVCNEGGNYNTGRNRMSINLCDESGIEISTLEYDLFGNEAEIYAISSDAQGNSIKNLLYSGPVVNKQLSHIIELDTVSENYTVGIQDGEGNILAEQTNVYSINNMASVGEHCGVQYFTVSHNPLSEALFSIFDNISLETRINTEYKYCQEDLEALTIDIPLSGGVKNDFSLPTEGPLHSSIVRWESEDINIINISSDYSIAYVIRDEEETKTNLIAHVTYGDFTLEKSFEVIVAPLSNVFASVNDVNTTINPDGTVNATISLQYAGTIPGEKITFIAVSQNPVTGEITDKENDTKDVPAQKYSSLNFEINGLNQNTGDEIKYYLWNEKNISLKNNPPTPLAGLNATGKARAITVSWQPSFDDNNAVEYYAVYRDGVLIDQVSECSYNDFAASRLNQHTYRVIPIDTNENKGIYSEASAASIDMFYVDFSDESSDGVNYFFNPDSARDAYAFITTVTDAEGKTSNCAHSTTTNHFITLFTDKDKVSGADKEIVIEVTYLDKQGDLNLVYNTIVPPGEKDSVSYARKKVKVATMENTNTWKTAVMRITDAEFKQSSNFSSGDFGFSVTMDDQMYIKRVEIIQADLYD